MAPTAQKLEERLEKALRQKMGLAIGLFLGMLGRFVVRATLAPNVGIIDPVGLFVIPVPVFLAGFLACYLPARRASQVDPNIALRAL